MLRPTPWIAALLMPGAAWGQIYLQPYPPAAPQPVPSSPAPAVPTPQPFSPPAVMPEAAAPAVPQPAVPPPAAPSPEPAEAAVTNPAASKNMIVLLRVTDKVLGRTKRFKVPTGRALQYEALEILPRRCVIDMTAKPEPQHSALVEIYEKADGVSPKRAFSGWMFAGNPSLSHLEHPYYDINIVSCTPRKDEAEKEEAKEKDTDKEKEPDSDATP